MCPFKAPPLLRSATQLISLLPVVGGTRPRVCVWPVGMSTPSPSIFACISRRRRTICNSHLFPRSRGGADAVYLVLVVWRPPVPAHREYFLKFIGRFFSALSLSVWVKYFQPCTAHVDVLLCAERAVNRYVHARDRRTPCRDVRIARARSCGRPCPGKSILSNLSNHKHLSINAVPVLEQGWTLDTLGCHCSGIAHRPSSHSRISWFVR